MFTNRQWPILDIAALKWVMRQKRNFQDGVARFSLEPVGYFLFLT